VSHGKMLDVIKNHSEYLYRTIEEIKYIVTTSTLLEGVNIPADRLIILDYRKANSRLSYAELNNLVGRAGRFNNIFAENDTDVRKLMPEIYIAKGFGVMQENARTDSFLRDRVRERELVMDDVRNSLLKNNESTKVDDEAQKKIKNMCNIDPESIEFYRKMLNDEDIGLATTKFGRLCYGHCVNFFDILRYEKQISSSLESLNEENIKIDDGKKFLDCIVGRIISNIPEKDHNKNWIYRLKTDYKDEMYNKYLKELIKNKNR